MILPTKNPAEILWESTDAQKLREFLESPTGQKVLRHLTDTTPDLMDGENVNKTLVRNGEVKGANAIFTALVQLTIEQPPQEKPVETYPSIDDESQWDGENPKPTTH